MSHPFSSEFRSSMAARCRAFPRIAHDGEGLKRAAVAITLVEADDGSTAELEYTMDRAGMLKATVVKSTGPTGHKIHERTTRDPWNP